MARLIDIIGKALSGEWGQESSDGKGIPVLRTTNFTNEGILKYDDVVLRHITKKNINDKMLRNGDIIIEKSGGSDKQPVGRVVFFEGEENKYLFNNFTGLLRVEDREKWIPKYVFYSLYSNYIYGGTRAYENRTTGLHNLQLDNYIMATEVREATLDEQANIVRRLDSVVNLINKQRQQLKCLDELVKSRFIELFGDPVKNPKKWETKNLKDITTKLGSGATPKGGNASYKEEGISLIRSMHVYNGRFDYENLAHIDEEQARRLDNVTVNSCDVLLNITGASVARCCIVPDDILPARVNQHVCIIRSKQEKIRPEFLNQILISDAYQAYLWNMAEAAGATRQALTKEEIENLKIILPPVNMQNQFATFVAQVDKSKLAVKKSLEELETLKKSLMQEYFG